MLTILVSVGAASPGETPSDQEVGLFGSTEPLQIRIEAPWSQLSRRLEADQEIEGRLVHLTPSGEAVSIGTKISTRGKSRFEVCSMPLLTLEVAPGAVRGTPFRGQQVVHLTTQCQSGIRSRDNLVQEYLSYQAYRLLSDHSLGVRLATLVYLDTEGKRPAQSSMAFFVEDLGVAASRLEIEWLKPTTVSTSTLEPDSMALLGLFQYMLGNTDWSARAAIWGEICCHNVAILGPPGAESDLIPVPYDLDSTGLVDPDYADPPRHLPIRRVRQRLYRGFCASNAYLPRTVERVIAARIELLALFDSSILLSSYGKRSTRKYLEDFFEILDDPKNLRTHILDKCR